MLVTQIQLTRVLFLISLAIDKFIVVVFGLSV